MMKQVIELHVRHPIDPDYRTDCDPPDGLGPWALWKWYEIEREAFALQELIEHRRKHRENEYRLMLVERREVGELDATPIPMDTSEDVSLFVDAKGRVWQYHHIVRTGQGIKLKRVDFPALLDELEQRRGAAQATLDSIRGALYTVKEVADEQR